MKQNTFIGRGVVVTKRKPMPIRPKVQPIREQPPASSSLRNMYIAAGLIKTV